MSTLYLPADRHSPLFPSLLTTRGRSSPVCPFLTFAEHGGPFTGAGDAFSGASAGPLWPGAGTGLLGNALLRGWGTLSPALGPGGGSSETGCGPWAVGPLSLPGGSSFQSSASPGREQAARGGDGPEPVLGRDARPVLPGSWELCLGSPLPAAVRGAGERPVHGRPPVGRAGLRDGWGLCRGEG